MKRALLISALVVGGIAAGLGCSEVVLRSVICRQAIGRWVGHGQLLAMTHGVGIYESDVGGRDVESIRAAIAAANLDAADRGEVIPRFALDSADQLLRAQFGDHRAFVQALQGAGLPEKQGRELIANQLRGVRWLEKRIASALQRNEGLCGIHAHESPGETMQPPRFRVSHIFLAAHSATPAEEVESKRKLIDSLARALAQGANFAQLATQVSEDEASKMRGGDLGFICSERIPPEFFAEVVKLHPGQLSAPFRSHLGFHIAQLTDVRPARHMSFEEVRNEIVAEMENQSRRAVLSGLIEQLTAAEFSRLHP